MKEYFGKKLEKFMKSKSRIIDELESLAYWIGYNKEFKHLNNLVKTSMTWDSYFKLLILMNKLLLDQKIDSNLVSGLLMTMRMKKKCSGKFEEMIRRQLLIPYKLYLQKRCLAHEIFNYEQKKTKIYQLLNLINLGVVPGEMLFLLGRYFESNIEFICDFNIILAQDIAFFYNSLVQAVSEPDLKQISLDLEKTHEKMYIIFYNCYYYREVREFAPRWLPTDIEAGLKTPEKYKKERKNKMNSVNIEMKQNKFPNCLNVEHSTKASLSQNERDRLELTQTGGLISEFVLIQEEQKRDQLRRQRLSLIQTMQRMLFLIN